MSDWISGNYHPTDSYSRLSAHTTNYKRLVECFERAVKVGPNDVELIGAVAIAYAELLERRLGLADAPVLTNTAPNNVVPIRRSTEDQPA